VRRQSLPIVGMPLATSLVREYRRLAVEATDAVPELPEKIGEPWRSRTSNLLIKGPVQRATRSRCIHGVGHRLFRWPMRSGVQSSRARSGVSPTSWSPGFARPFRLACRCHWCKGQELNHVLRSSEWSSLGIFLGPIRCSSTRRPSTVFEKNQLRKFEDWTESHVRSRRLETGPGWEDGVLLCYLARLLRLIF